MKIILASASLGRKKILSDSGLKFTVLPAEIDERKITSSNEIKLVKKIAKAKAEAVYKKLLHRCHSDQAKPRTIWCRAKRVEESRPQPHADAGSLDYGTHRTVHPFARDNTIIIAADSMVYFKNKTYGKPKDKTEARKFLRMLSGQTHEFITGVCILASQGYTLQKPIIKSCKSQITFKKFTEKEIEEQVETTAVTAHAGAYSIDDKIIKNKIKIIGSKTNVIGLPLEILLPILRINGVKI